ncbi:Similar to hypothetical protein FOXB_14048 [Fusarium oxysporum Fo5176]; acc. no. EGU75452 [Pyronema omphalodes CBS 100304]|uniref:Uncharacterized protein n=1 Tax=Pyronema omphalodes (strain CBS 100304) TaxID=1076935 RepID=U4L5M8_PYROM|nr:Similar to hypothetical protein FOXB_14048 [Fusarium oxysporum Fo5176]; acc. no. EGU75452 [Pyronema omphalodes CBS 100304]
MRVINLRRLKCLKKTCQNSGTCLSRVKINFVNYRGIFRRYSMHSTLGVILLHRHFLLNQDEKLIEYPGVSTPWTVGISSSSIVGGRITPRCWSISSDKQLQPTEFRFVIPGDDLFEPDFPEDFIDDFYGFLLRRGLAALMGLTMFNATDAISGNREVERTIRRISVTIPVQEAQFEGVEAAWTFGCQENLSDSQFLNARVWWVCQECKPASD